METTNVIKTFIHKNIGKFIFIFSVISLTSVTTFWWLSIFSLIFYAWNLFNEKEYARLTTTFFFLTILLIIFNFSVIKPTNKWADKMRAEWNKTGFDSSFIPGAQQNLNVIARSVEQYKSTQGSYPNQLSDIQNISMNLLNMDMSYRINDEDGQTNPVMFYYEKINSDKYYLAGVGRDGEVKTKDDLLPQISLEQKKSTGLIKYVVKSFSEEEIKEENGVMRMFKKSGEIENIDENN